MTRKRRPKVDDPFLRACTACGACVGEPCCTTGKNQKPLALRATRLVHAARLEEEHPDA